MHCFFILVTIPLSIVFDVETTTQNSQSAEPSLPKAPYMPDFTIHIQWLSFIHQLRGAEPSPQLKYAQNTLETSIKEIGPFFIAGVLIKQYRAMMISCTKPTALLLYVCFWTAWNRDLKTIRWEWAIIILSCTWLPSGGQHIKLIFFAGCGCSPQLIAHSALIRKKPNY